MKFALAYLSILFMFDLSKASVTPGKYMSNPDYFGGDISGIGNVPAGMMSRATQGATITSEAQLWPKGVVPYEIDRSIQDPKNIYIAMRHIQDNSCIRFVPRTANTKNYLRIVSGSGCHSWQGVRGGGQELSLQNGGCSSISTAVHELMHALGFWHEHQRSDRDKFIQINLQNVESGKESQFQKNSPSQNKLFGNDLDFDSVMMYSPRAFSYNNRAITIQSKVAGKQVKEDDPNSGLSAWDAWALRELYKNQCQSPK